MLLKKALITGTVQLICAFVFAYAKRRFSHEVGKIIFSTLIKLTRLDAISNVM